jgi:hypothetical protein
MHAFLPIVPTQEKITGWRGGHHAFGVEMARVCYGR